MKQLVVKITFVVGLVATLATLACRTTSPTIRVNKEDKQITVYSSADKNSALGDPKKSSAIKDSLNVVKDKLSRDPGNPSLLLDLANLYLVQGNFKDARENCRKALSYNLKNVAGRKLLGRIELESGDVDKAEIIMNGLGGANSKDSEILNSLGMIALHKQEFGDAFDLFNRGIKISPDNVAIRMNLGTLYLKFKQVQPAAVQFERVLQIIPGHPDALMHLAIAKATRGDFKDAEELYNRVLTADKYNPIVRFDLAVLQRSEGNLKEALENVKLFLKQKDVEDVKYKSAEQLRDQLENEIERQIKAEEEKKKQVEAKTLSAKPLDSAPEVPDAGGEGVPQ